MIFFFVGGFLLGAGVQWLQIYLTGRIVKKRARTALALSIAVKLAVWAALFSGMLLWSRAALYASIVGSAVCLIAYGMIRFFAASKEE